MKKYTKTQAKKLKEKFDKHIGCFAVPSTDGYLYIYSSGKVFSMAHNSYPHGMLIYTKIDTETIVTVQVAFGSNTIASFYPEHCKII